MQKRLKEGNIVRLFRLMLPKAKAFDLAHRLRLPRLRAIDLGTLG